MHNLASDFGQMSEEGLSARALLSAIRRHWALVLCSTLLMCAAGAFIGLGLPAWFKAEGVVVIPAVPQRLSDLQELPDPTPDVNVIESQVDILQSRSVIEPVVRSFRLWAAPEFQPMEYPKGWSWQTLDARLDEIWRDLWGLPSSPQNSVRKPAAKDIPSDLVQAPTRAEIDGAVEAYKGFLGVDTDGHSMTIRVSFKAFTPETAAAVVNAHIDSYRNFEVQTKVAAADHANSALRSKVAELRKQLQAAEFAVSHYREEHNLTGAATDRAGVSAQLAALNSQLITARAELAENQTRAAAIGAGGSELPEVVTSGTISGLRSQEAQLAAREADLARYHGDQYPELQQVRASMRNLQGQIGREIGRNRAAALQLVERSRARERSLQQSITQLTSQLNTSDAGLQQLEGNAESIRALLLNLEKREAETAANPAFITANTIVASLANPYATSTSASAKTLAFAGGFVGLTLGALLSIFLELRDRGFRTSAQVQQHTGSLTVSATPRAPARNRKKPVDLILTENRSAFAEAFRVSWAKIQLAIDYKGSGLPVGGSRRATIVGITSATSGEGKSLHAVGFARTAALAGDDVVFVDADLRRSGASRLISQQSRFTLGDLLQHRCAGDDVIALETRSGMHFVPSMPSPDILWTNQEIHRFYHFINELKRRFSLVLVDLPPLVGVAETIRLATVVDSMVLIVRWARTERQFVQFALDTLRSANVPANAVILNDIDLKAQRRRGYRDHTMVYTDKRLYRAASEYPRPPTTSKTPSSTGSRATTRPDTPIPGDLTSALSGPPIPRPADPEPHPGDAPDRLPSPAGSTIERWYDKYHG
jgi:polysaccharide biosynthesis transport protein